MVVIGRNEIVPVAGVVFHVQTEHHEMPTGDVIQTEVFRGGRIALRRRYEPAAGQGDDRIRILNDHLQRVHRSVVHQLQRKASRLEGRGGEPEGSEWRCLRRLIGRLRQAVGVETPSDDLPARMRAVATALAVIAGHRSSSKLRREDFEEILRFRDEAQQMAREADPENRRCLDLWQRLAASTYRLARINSRREVLEHDRQLGLLALDELRLEPVHRPLRPDEFQQLRKLLGRDPGLDALLEHPGDLRVGPVRRELARILRELGSTELVVGEAKGAGPAGEQGPRPS